MPLWEPCQSKPPPGTPIDWTRSLAQGLVGCWTFAEGAGIPVNAVTGQQAASNTMPWASGRWGSCLSNTALAKFVQTNVPNGTALSVTGTRITMAAWAYPTISNAYQCLIVKVGGTTRQYGLFLSALGTGNIFISFNPSGGANYAVSPGWAVNTWNHICATYDGANVRVYINGVPANTTALATTITEVSGSTLYFGYDNGNSNFGINGSLDAPMVWNRVLNQGEVAALCANQWQAFGAPRSAYLMRPAGGGPWPWFFDQPHSGGFAEMAL